MGDTANAAQRPKQLSMDMVNGFSHCIIAKWHLAYVFYQSCRSLVKSLAMTHAADDQEVHHALHLCNARLVTTWLEKWLAGCQSATNILARQE